jgi:hypothetical protein
LVVRRVELDGLSTLGTAQVFGNDVVLLRGLAVKMGVLVPGFGDAFFVEFVGTCPGNLMGRDLGAVGVGLEGGAASPAIGQKM